MNGDATRHLRVVRVATSDPAASSSAGVVGRALRSCAAAVGRALRQLGQHYSAGAWCDELDCTPRGEHRRGA